MPDFTDHQYHLSRESGIIIGIAFEIHNILGKGFLEIVYKDAIEFEFRKREIPFTREKEFKIQYKGIMLPHRFFADFVVYDQIILEIKAKEGIAEEHLAQTLNYLKVSGCKLGLILNFGESGLKIKRVIL